jgi:hypothetical protein
MFPHLKLVDVRFGLELIPKFGRLLLTIMAIVVITGTCYAESTRSCTGNGDCPTGQNADWSQSYLALSNSLLGSSSSTSDATTVISESSESTSEASSDSYGLTLQKAENATTAELDRYQLTWHDTSLTAKDTSGALLLQSQTLQAAFEPFEGIHLDTSFGGIDRYLHEKIPVGAIKATGNIGGNDLAILVSRQLQIDSLETIRHGLTSTEEAFSAKRKLFWGLKLKAELRHRDLSDRNSLNAFQLAPEYDRNLLGIDFGLGTRFRYISFAHHATDGYYNPLVSYGEQIFLNTNYDSGRFYFNFDVAGGRGTSKTNVTSTASSDFSGEGSGTLGLRIGQRFLAELTATGGDYGLNYPVKGYSQMSTGFRFTYLF